LTGGKAGYSVPALVKAACKRAATAILRAQKMTRSVLFFTYEDNNNDDELWYDSAGKFYEVTSRARVEFIPRIWTPMATS
jgi:hypothetical protein